MFANQVKNVRTQLEMSQKKLANALGVSFATINRWENSRNEPSQLAKNLMRQMMEKQGITEEMKACDQMEWVRAVNGIRNMAEEQRMFELKQRKKREKC